MASDVKMYLYVFKRPVPLEAGPLNERGEYYIYAETRPQAFERFNKNHVEEIKAGFKPELLRREPW